MSNKSLSRKGIVFFIFSCGLSSMTLAGTAVPHVDSEEKPGADLKRANIANLTGRDHLGRELVSASEAERGRLVGGTARDVASYRRLP